VPITRHNSTNWRGERPVDRSPSRGRFLESAVAVTQENSQPASLAQKSEASMPSLLKSPGSRFTGLSVRFFRDFRRVNRPRLFPDRRPNEVSRTGNRQTGRSAASPLPVLPGNSPMKRIAGAKGIYLQLFVTPLSVAVSKGAQPRNEWLRLRSLTATDEPTGKSGCGDKKQHYTCNLRPRKLPTI